MIESGSKSLPIPVRDAVGEDTVLAAIIARLERRRAERPSMAEASWLAAVATPNAIARALSRGLARRGQRSSARPLFRP